MAKKKTTEMHKLQGTFQPCRHGKGQEQEIPVLSGDSKPPKWLDLAGERLYRTLAKTGIITAVNVDLLAIYCNLCVKVTVSLQNNEEVTPSLLAQLRGFSRDLGITGKSVKPEVAQSKKKELPYGWHSAHKKMWAEGVFVDCPCVEGLPFGAEE